MDAVTKDRIALFCRSDEIAGKIRDVFETVPWGEQDVSFAMADDPAALRGESKMRAEAYRVAGVPVVALIDQEGRRGQDMSLQGVADAAILFDGKTQGVDATGLGVPVMHWRVFSNSRDCDPMVEKKAGILHRTDQAVSGDDIQAYISQVLRGAIAQHLVIFEPKESTRYPQEMRSFCMAPPAGGEPFAVLSVHADEPSKAIAQATLSAAARLSPIIFHGDKKAVGPLAEHVFMPTTARELHAHLRLVIDYPDRVRHTLLAARRQALAYASPYAVQTFLSGLQPLRSARNRVVVLCRVENDAQAMEIVAQYLAQGHPDKDLYLLTEETLSVVLPERVHVLHPAALETADFLQEEGPVYCTRWDAQDRYGSDYLGDLMQATWTYPARAIVAGQGGGWSSANSVRLYGALVDLRGLAPAHVRSLLNGGEANIPAIQIDTDQGLGGMTGPFAQRLSRDVSAMETYPPSTVDETNCDYLVITNHYPAEGNPYANMFTHQRVKAYLSTGGLRVAVFNFDPVASEMAARYSYEGVNVVTGEINELLMVLSRNKPKGLLLHLPPNHVLRKIANKEIDIPSIWWLHGAESYPASARSYIFINQRKYMDLCIMHHTRNALMKKISRNQKMGIVPVSRTLRDELQRLYGLELNRGRTNPIANYVNSEGYAYVPKKAEDRFRIVCVKNYSTYTYAGDLVAGVIKELSQREIFNKLSFTICGRGELFEQQTIDLAPFDNVAIYRGFLTPAALAALYQRHGILLMPTRHDTHGVSRDEAMSCGAVPITTRAGAIPEFVDDTCAVITEPENVVEMADAIEALCADPERFLALSERAAKHARATCGFDQTIQREIDWIGKFTASR